MDKLEIKITLPRGCEIPPAKMITLMKWFQKWVSPNIKKIHLKSSNDYKLKHKLEEDL